MSSTSPQYKDLTRLSHVPRWVIVPMVKSQSVADHSFRVAIIVMHLLSERSYSREFVGECVKFALLHDANEIYTGDIPGIAKREGRVAEGAPQRPGCAPSFNVKFVVKLADIVETITWFMRYECCGPRRTSIIGDLMGTFEEHLKSTYADSHKEAIQVAQRIIEEGLE